MKLSSPSSSNTSSEQEITPLTTAPDKENPEFLTDFITARKKIEEYYSTHSLKNRHTKNINLPSLITEPVDKENVTHITGFAIANKELDLTSHVSEIKTSQSTLDSNMYLFKNIPHHQGVWCEIDPKELDLKGKRVALVVHGHSTDSIFNALSNYGLTKASQLFKYFQKPLPIVDKQNSHYGLDTLVNLGRMLDQHICLQDGVTPRYDYVIGYAYSSWGHLKGIAAQFAEDVSINLSRAGSVDMFAHSMAGPMTRWALEQEGLGEWIHNCVFIASPHEGVPFCLLPGYLEITPTELLATTDLITKNSKLDADASDFMRDLASTESPYEETANYHTLTGYEHRTLTWDTLPEGTLPEIYNFCAGTAVQEYYNARFGSYKVMSDGLVPTYSSHSQVLQTKSKQYRENMDYNHAKLLSLDHRTITGDDFSPTTFHYDEKLTTYENGGKHNPYLRVLHVLKNWIKHWPE